MTETEFTKGIRVIETAMQGVPDERDGRGKVIKTGTNFNHDFLTYLFKVVKTTPKELWENVVEIIAKSPCKPRDLTVANFLHEIDFYNEQRQWAKARWKVKPARPLTDIRAACQRVLDDANANEFAKLLAREELARLSNKVATAGPGEKTKGGEKYRRLKDSEKPKS